MKRDLEPGTELVDGWVVVRRITEISAGPHSLAYEVTKAGERRGFLKVIDFDWYMLSSDPVEVLRSVTQAFYDERRLLLTARENGLDRVVRYFTSGVIRPDPAAPPIQYLICELADCDARRQMRARDRRNDAWALRVLHHIATGLAQLHSHDIAHQDLQPANVLCFGELNAKVGDLGRAADPDSTAEHVEYQIAGDETFAPPELLYDAVDREWKIRRVGCDIYLLGSLVVSLLVGTAVTPAVQEKLAPAHRAAEWTGTYAEVLPYVRYAFVQFITEFDRDITARLPDKKLRTALVGVVRELCDPDPARRGDQLARLGKGDPYSLERYIARFDYLAREIELIPKLNKSRAT